MIREKYRAHFRVLTVRKLPVHITVHKCQLCLTALSLLSFLNKGEIIRMSVIFINYKD